VRSLLFVGLALAASIALPPSAQQQGAERPLFLSVRTDLVTLPVAVVARNGAFVSGLTREQFTVYDNGEPRAIEFFTSEELPATVGLVIDSSRSMRDRRAAVSAAGLAFVGSSHPLDELFTVNFNETVWPGLPPGVTFTRDAEQLRAALDRAPANGMTALYDAVDVALEYVQLGTRDRKALIVVSDGGDNASTHTMSDVLEHARRADVVIYAVILADPDNHEARPQILRKLARETGGEVFAPKQPAAITSVFGQIASEIRAGYTIGFLPAETSEDGFRAIRVVADAGDRRPLIVRTRAGYYAGASSRAPR
jgi:VWFA-related protein